MRKKFNLVFTLMNSFWGFDRMDFNLGENLIVDIEKLIEYRKKNPDKVKKLNYNSNRIEDLIIQSREFGRLEIGKIYKKEIGDTVNYCLLQLNHGGLNFETLYFCNTKETNKSYNGNQTANWYLDYPNND